MKLIDILKEKLKNLDDLEFPLEEPYLYFEFLNKEIAINKDLSTITNGNILLALVVLNNKNIDFEDTFLFFADEICSRIDEVAVKEIINFINIILDLNDYEVLNELLENDLLMSKLEFDSEKVNKIELTKSIFAYKKYGLEILEDIEVLKKFTKLILPNCYEIGYAFAQFAAYRDNYEVLKLDKNYVKLLKMFDKDINNLFDEFDRTFNINAALSVIKQISEKNFELSKQKKNFERNINQQKMIYNKTIKYLQQINSDKSLIIPDDILQKLDDDLFIELIKIVLNNDRNIYSNLQIENIRKDKYNEIERIFLSNQIDLSKLEENLKNKLVNNVNKDNLEKIINYLTTSELKWIKNHPNFVQVILNTDANVLKNVINWIKLSYVSKEFIYKNIGILLANNDIRVNEEDVVCLFEKVKNNIDLLSQLTNLNNKIMKNETILFQETSELKKIIKLCKIYKLNFNSENSKSYSLDILNKLCKFDDLDSFIELGFASYIKENPQLLKSNSEHIISRLSIMVNTNLNPYSNERLLGSITNGKNFFVPEEELKNFNLLKVNEYINDNNYDILKNNNRLTISKSTLQLDVVNYLDNYYKKSDLEYCFDEVIISRVKFLRNLECLVNNGAEGDYIFCALTYNSVLDDNSINYIKNILNQKIKKL